MRQGKRGEENEKGRDIQEYATGSCPYAHPVHVAYRQGNQLALRNGRGTIDGARIYGAKNRTVMFNYEPINECCP